MMVKFQHLFITGVILFACADLSANVIERSSDHLLIQNNSGKVFYQNITRINGREFRSVDWAKTEEAEARYLAKKINEVRVKHASSGALSSAKVPVSIPASIPRQTVLKNLLTKAVAGGRIAAGIGSGPVGWAITAATAYDLIAPTLKEHGYVWDSNAQNFVTDKEYIIEITSNDGRKDSQGNALVLYRIGLSKRSYDYGYESYKSTLDGLCDKASRDVDAYAESRGYGGHQSNQYSGSTFYGGCKTVTGWGEAIKAFWTIKPNKKQPITQAEFDDIIGPAADADPTRYVNATAKDDGTIPGVSVSPNVTVPKGTVVTIGPYTDSDGQPKQITVTFDTANGETTVNVQVVPRPDLSPNSPSAPSSSPKTGGQSAPSSDSAGQSTPEADAEPDKKDEDKPKDGSFLCNLFPDILACAQMGETQEDEPFNIPNITNETTFKPDFFLPDTGQCPAPQTVNMMGRQYGFSYDWLCRFAEMIRFLIIGIAGISAAYIMFSGLKKD